MKSPRTLQGPLPWLKLWHSVLDSAKIAGVTEALRWRYVALLCVACKLDENGRLPDVNQTAYMIRLDVDETVATLKELCRAKLIDYRAKSYWIHDWDHWQNGKSAAAKRQAAYRKRLKEAHNARHNARDNASHNESATSLARRGEGEGELEERRESPPPPSERVTELGPEYTAVGQWAMGMGGDVSWGRWVEHQGRIGHSPALIRRAIEISAGAGKLSQAYVAAKLQAWAKNGAPPEVKAEANGRHIAEPTAAEMRAKAEKPDFDRLPDTPENRALRAMWEG